MRRIIIKAFELYDLCKDCQVYCESKGRRAAYRFKAVRYMETGGPLKHILLWMPLCGCHRVLQASERLWEINQEETFDASAGRRYARIV